jgi:hypothetical protein
MEVQQAIQAMLDIERGGNRDGKAIMHSRENEAVPSASGDSKAAAAG